MDWNKNGTIDASDILITELFEKELADNEGKRHKEENVEPNNSVSVNEQHR